MKMGDPMPCMIDDEIGESERLEALERSALLDAPPEEAFDRLTRLATALSHAEERWRVLLQVNNAVVTCLDRQSLFEAVTGALRGVVPFDRAALVLEDPADGVFKLLGIAGTVSSPAIFPYGKQWPRQGTRCGWVAEHGIPLLTADLRESPRYLEHDPLIQNGILSALSVPLRDKGKVIGTLNVGSREVGRYGEKDSELLLAI